MKIRLLSDIHLEFGPCAIAPVSADVVVLAGDIGCGLHGVKWARERFNGVPVIYVCGNHEFYGEKYPRQIEKLREEAKGSTVTVVENKFVSIGEYTIFGCTLWTDMALAAEPGQLKSIGDQMNDYHQIRSSTTYRKLQPADTCRIHNDSMRHLERFLQEHDPRKSIIVTHHAPSYLSTPPEYQSDPLRTAFSSDLELLIKKTQPRLWVHGHLHASFDYCIGATRIICNPRGYTMELNPDFDPGLVVQL